MLRSNGALKKKLPSHRLKKITIVEVYFCVCVIQDSPKFTVYYEFSLYVCDMDKRWMKQSCVLNEESLYFSSDPPIVSLRLGLELGSDALDEGLFVIHPPFTEICLSIAFLQ